MESTTSPGATKDPIMNGKTTVSEAAPLEAPLFIWHIDLSYGVDFRERSRSGH